MPSARRCTFLSTSCAPAAAQIAALPACLGRAIRHKVTSLPLMRLAAARASCVGSRALFLPDIACRTETAVVPNQRLRVSMLL